MNLQHSVNNRCTSADRISDISQAVSVDDKAGKIGRIWIRNEIRISLQCMGIKRNPGENRPCRMIPFAIKDMHLTIPGITMRRGWASSRLHNMQMDSIYTPGSRTPQNIKKGRLYRQQDFNAPVCLQSAQGRCLSAQQHRNNPARVVVAIGYKRRGQRVQRFCVIEVDTTDMKHSVIMDRSEDRFHCRDLQAEFEELRAQQRALEDQVRSLETRIEDQFRVLNDKYRAEINMFLHRVHSLHEQFSNLANRCSHAEESITVLKFMMDKKLKEAPSTSSAKQNEPDPYPEESTARKISHIEID